MKSSEKCKFRILITSTGSTLSNKSSIEILESIENAMIETRSIEDERLCPGLHEMQVLQNRHFKKPTNTSIESDSLEYAPPEPYYRQAYELCEWADILVLAPIDANTMAKILHGICDNLLLTVIRGWDISKRIFMIPEMSSLMWENPMTKNQLKDFRSNWPWVQVMKPILWKHDKESSRRPIIVDGLGELVNFIRNQIEYLKIGNDTDTIDCTIDCPSLYKAHCETISKNELPNEIWSLIFEMVGDWEISKALNIYCAIPMPIEWQQRAIQPEDKLGIYMRRLEWTMLTASTIEIIDRLKEAPDNLKCLSSLCVKLVVKFCLTGVLSHLETNSKDIFWASFGQKLLPTMASALLGQTKILDWWRTSASFITKEYTTETMDGASKMGFVHVLEWWRRSGLSLKYTEVAMEQASARGHVDVLDWWKKASTELFPNCLMPEMRHRNEIDVDEFHCLSGTHSSLPLLPGKSLLTAAQNNQTQVLRWWDQSCIPIGHSESVARVASQYGNVEVLETWLELKGEKMSFDSQILIDPTKNGHIEVLQWWKNLSRGTSGQPGRTIHYKTCDIEEALEDSIRNEKITLEVKKWWAHNGLNLGLQVREWTRIRVL